jgi:hypothetical protein
MPPAPNNWSQLEPLIDQVLDTPPAERLGLIERLSGGDASRRAELERLIAECSAGHALFDRPAAERFAALIDDETASSDEP